MAPKYFFQSATPLSLDTESTEFDSVPEGINTPLRYRLCWLRGEWVAERSIRSMIQRIGAKFPLFGSTNHSMDQSRICISLHGTCLDNIIALPPRNTPDIFWGLKLRWREWPTSDQFRYFYQISCRLHYFDFHQRALRTSKYYSSLMFLWKYWNRR